MVEYTGAWPIQYEGIFRGVHPPLDLWVGNNWQILVYLFQSDGVTPLDLSPEGTSVFWSMSDVNGNQINSASLFEGIIFSGSPTLGQLILTIPQNASQGAYWDRLDVTVNGQTATMSSGKVRIHTSFALLDDLNVAGLGPLDATDDWPASSIPPTKPVTPTSVWSLLWPPPFPG